MIKIKIAMKSVFCLAGMALAAHPAAAKAAKAAKAAVAKDPATFLEYCQSEGKSEDELYTLALLKKKYDTEDCVRLDEVARTFRSLHVSAPNLVDVRAFNYFERINTLLISSRAHVRSEQIKPRSKELVNVYLDASMDALPYFGPQVEKMRLRHAQDINLDNLGRYPELKELWIQNVRTNSSFAGLSKLTKLEKVKIINANVASSHYIPKAENLTSLILTETGLTDLSGLPVLAKVTTLNMQDNGFTKMEPITRMKNLESITLSDNPIEDIDCLLDFPELKVIHANSIGVSDWQFIEKIPKLSELSVADNDIDTAALSKLVNEVTPLLRLDISSNEITDLAPLNWFDRIAWVDATGNQLSFLGRMPDTLWWLIADENRIQDFRHYYGPALRELSLQNNGIVNLTGMGQETFLEQLDLRNNLIEDLMPMKNFCCAGFVRLANNPLGTTIEKTAANCPLDAKTRDIQLFCKY